MVVAESVKSEGIPRILIADSDADSHSTNNQNNENMTNFNSVSHDYDEDLSLNPFFQTFLQSYVDLFSQCVLDHWIICVPRLDSLPKYSALFTLEDFTANILKPWNVCQELQSRNAVGGILGAGASICNRNWNYLTLTDIKVERIGSMLYVENPGLKFVHQIQVLFEETFYTPDKKTKYKILCVSGPLNSSHHSLQQQLPEVTFEDEPLDPALWNLNSLRDCIDFLWTHGRRKTLETYDSFIRLFLHNHRTLVDLPLPVIRDLVLDLYHRSLGFLKREEKKRQRKRNRQLNRGDSSVSSCSTDSSLTSTSNESCDSVSTSRPRGSLATAAILNFQIATETYVLHGIYPQLVQSLTCAVSWEDGNLNKLLRNLAEIHPQDLEISQSHWDHLSRAKNELSRLGLQTSPLGKLGCLLKTMKICGAGSGSIGADELLPIWVYLIVKASATIDNWTAQLQFLKQFRFSVSGETGIGDNEASYLITTLEASLLFLNSGKIRALGLADTERDTGTPCDDYVAEFWLRCLFGQRQQDQDSDDPEILDLIPQMYESIRQGNLEKLEHLIQLYENERINQAMTPQQNHTVPDTDLCHPLCTCSTCSQILRKKEKDQLKNTAQPLDPIFNHRNQEAGLSLLHVACIYGRPKIVDYLLAHGPEAVHLADNHGLLPIHHAAGRGHQNALLLLLHSGSPIDSPDNSLNTPLNLAALNGHESCVKALIYYAEHSRKPMNPSHPNSHGDTPLHHSAKFGFIGIVQLLVESGASISVTNQRQKTPIDLAHDVHIVRTLQRSLRRRSLIHNSYHGDFVNVDMVRKGEHETGVVMLISEPMTNEVADAAYPEAEDFAEAEVESMTPVVPQTTATLPRIRKLSTVITPSFARDRNTVPRNSTFRKKRSLNNNNYEDFEGSSSSGDFEEMRFHIENLVPELPVPETEHLRKISVNSLDELVPGGLCVPTQNEDLQVEHKVSRESIVQRGTSKLFHAIVVEDLPLALFYLGIPVEEIENPGNDSSDIKAEAEKYLKTLLETSPCHPLCPCSKCTARSQGILTKLNLDINSVRNAQGLNPLHLASQMNWKVLVLILLRNGSDLSLRSQEGKLAFDYAKENYHEEIAECLQIWKETVQNYGRK